MIASSPGFYGKVTSHGDFVMRRLPTPVVAAWDDWLQQCMVASRQQLGNGWLTHYLSSPIWRFAIADGVLGAQAWAGVMMPSVDRVGRHFPLMLAAPAMTATPLLSLPHRDQSWFDTLEDLARSSLGASFALDDFDQALATQAVQADTHVRVQAEAPWRLRWPEPDLVPDALMHALAQGRSFWWSEGGPGIAPSMLVCQGLPAPSHFAAMLAGGWQTRGWNEESGAQDAASTSNTVILSRLP